MRSMNFNANYYHYLSIILLHDHFLDVIKYMDIYKTLIKIYFNSFTNNNLLVKWADVL